MSQSTLHNTSNKRPGLNKHDSFLADAVRPHTSRLGYLDGFRFGFGFFIAGLLIAVLLGGLTWGIVSLLQIS